MHDWSWFEAWIKLLGTCEWLESLDVAGVVKGETLEEWADELEVWLGSSVEP